MAKKKILFLHSSLEVGGAERLRLFLIKKMDTHRYDVRVLCIGKKGAIGEKIKRLGYRVEELGLDPVSKSIYVTYKLFKYLIDKKPYILHSSLFNANFHGRIAGLFARIPCLLTEEHGEHKQITGIKSFPFILADFLLSRLTNFIICCSEELKDDILKKEKLPRNKVISIENCLDADSYGIKTSREEIRKRHNISDELTFIVVAGLKQGKGHKDLIEVFRDIKDMGYDFKCFFAGDGLLEKGLKLKVESLKLDNNIIFLGTVDNISDYLNASDVFILPSLSEGLSIALMEAMLIGLASIVTDVGSNPDLIKTDFNGIVISSGDREELKKAIIFYFKHRDLIKQFGQRSRSIILERYSSMDKYIGKYYECWDRCCNNQG